MTSAPVAAAPGICGRVGLAGLGLSVGCFLVTAVLGPSAEEPGLAGSGPPFELSAHPGPGLVIALVAAGIALGAAGLGLCLYAAAQGVRRSPVPLLVTGLLATAAFAVMPPVGSSDHLNYTAYGRMVVLGHDPYVTHASRFKDDPVIGAVQEWGDTPSVYGPIVTAQEAFASWVGGASVRLTVFVLSVTNALAFVLTGLLLYRRAATDAGRLRAVLLWTANPLLLFHLVSGAHNDALGIAAAVAALTLFTGGRSAGATGGLGRVFGTGLLVGAGAAIKLPAALAGGGPGWVLLADWWRGGRRVRGLGGLLALTGGAALVALVAFVAAGPNALSQVRRAARMVSLASPWHLVDSALGVGRQRTLIQYGVLLLAGLLVWLLVRSLPDASPATGGPVAASAGGAGASLRVSAALVLGWLFAAQYALPWYDGLGWAVLAMLAASGFDGVLLAHTTALSLAYLPARRADVIGLPHHLLWLERTVRPLIMPWVLAGVLAALVLTARRRLRQAPPGR